MKLNAEEAEVLRKLLSVLGEARHEFVIAGGQAARLFRLHPLAQPVDWDPLLTRDVDVATRMKGHAGSVDIGNALKGAGFTLRFDGDDKPPLTHYILGGSELEFIVPDTPERHSTGATISVLGASAQKVADLEPLLVAPIEVLVPDVGGVRVPNPAAYLIQKVITLTARRSITKKGKDALYVHDTLTLFSNARGLQPEIVAQAELVLDTLARKQRKRLAQNVASLGDSHTDFVGEAARQATEAGRPGRSVEAFATAMRLGLRDLLGDLSGGA